MPAGDGSLALRICPDGFPAELLQPPAQDGHAAHHQHDATSSERCIFAVAAIAGPVPQASLATAALLAGALEPFDFLSPSLLPRRYQLAQPRAPPALS